MLHQWEYLSHIHLLTKENLNEILISEHIVYQSLPSISSSINIFQAIIEDKKPLMAVCTGPIEVIVSGQIAIPLAPLPPKVLRALKKIATISNPTFFQHQKMRLSTWNIPTYIFCGQRDEEFLYIPRGLLEKIVEVLSLCGFDVTCIYKRNSNPPLSLTFNGKLYDYQQKALSELERWDEGVLVAPTGTGKTIIAISLIVKRSLRTLIVVHVSTLIDQWIDALTTNIPELKKKDIGVLGKGRKKLKGKIDIAMIQSLSKQSDVESLTHSYDFLIVDECHRIPTVTAEPVMHAIQVPYILGLTATPLRKDSLHPIIYMLTGSIRYTVKDVLRSVQIRKVILSSTSVEEITKEHTIHEVWETIINSIERNQQIVDDIILNVEEHRSPLILSDRLEHLSTLLLLVHNKCSVPLYLLQGNVGKKERNSILNKIRDHYLTNTSFCLFATGSLIGEGFDLPNLDTMILTMPISFKGRLTQYVGRLHRSIEGIEKEIRVYDYVDIFSPMTISMAKKRIAAYKKLGYTIEASEKIKKYC